MKNEEWRGVGEGDAGGGHEGAFCPSVVATVEVAFAESNPPSHPDDGVGEACGVAEDLVEQVAEE